jgi:hypothetical protein
MSRIQDIIVAEKDEDFSKLLQKSALIAKFLTGADSERFSQKNDRLRQHIENACHKILGTEGMEAHAYIGYDWWPDHTRHVELDAHSFQQPLFQAIHALLVDEFDEWRIQVVVYREIIDGTTMIGSVLIWSDKLIVDRALYDWMSKARFDVLSGIDPRSFSLSRDDLKSPRYNIMNDPE